ERWPTSLPRLRADAPQSKEPDGHRLSSVLGCGHTRCTKSSAETPIETCAADPFADLRWSMCFAQADARRNFGRGPVRQRMKSRGDEENCKAAANRLRKNRREPAWPIPLSPAPEHATQRSNASFETKHRPPAAFPELPSWPQSVAQRM